MAHVAEIDAEREVLADGRRGGKEDRVSSFVAAAMCRRHAAAGDQRKFALKMSGGAIHLPPGLELGYWGTAIATASVLIAPAPFFWCPPAWVLYLLSPRAQRGLPWRSGRSAHHRHRSHRHAQRRGGRIAI